MPSGLTIGFALDRQWHLLRGEMIRDKKPDLLALCRVLAAERVPYALIGGLALQVHHPEPRTTIDIAEADEETLDDVPLRVIRLEDLLREKLRAGSDPARRRTKRVQDLLDAQVLLDANPDLAKTLSPDERALLDQLPG